MKNRNTISIFRAILVALACLGPLPKAQAVDPPPDGGYPGANTAEGDYALFSLTTGFYNTANGYGALYYNITGYQNTATGLHALFSNTTGFYNTANGDYALNYNTTGNRNTATGVQALYRNTIGSYNTANGLNALFHNTTGSYNTANGVQALNSNTAGIDNTANGDQALYSNTTGNDNTATGFDALPNNTTGNYNTANGQGALTFNTTGSDNIALGEDAGRNVTTAHNVICIGAEGNNVSNSCYIGQTFNATSSGGTAVFVNANGRLGTATSSRRFKQEIKPMEGVSEALFALKPVTFRYKKAIDPQGIPQFGLVAEEVEKVNPDLVVRDKEGKPYSVRYEQVNAMLLNEFLKEHRKVEGQAREMQEQKSIVSQLKSTVAAQQVIIAQQQKGMGVLTA